MIFADVERAAGLSAGSNTVSPHSVGSGDVPETKPDAFSAKPKVFLAASTLRFWPG